MSNQSLHWSPIKPPFVYFLNRIKSHILCECRMIKQLQVNHRQGQILVLWVIWYVIFNNVRRSSLSCCGSLSLSLPASQKHTKPHRHGFINSLEQLILHTGHVKQTDAVGISSVSLHQLKASKIKTLPEDVKCISFLHCVHIFGNHTMLWYHQKSANFSFLFFNIFWDIMYLNMLNILRTINKINSSVIMYAYILTIVTTYSSFWPN